MPLFDEHTPFSEVAESALLRTVSESGLFSEGKQSHLMRLAPSWTRETFNGTESSSNHRTSTPIKVIDGTHKLTMTGRSGSKFTSTSRFDQYGPRVIFMAHQTESIVAQATNKFTDLINKKSFSIKSVNKDVAKYILARFKFIGRCVKPMLSINALLKELSRDYVAYGNAYLIKVYNKNEQILWVDGKRLQSAVQIHGEPERGVVSGYFRIDPRTIEPRFHKTSGKHIGWVEKVEGHKDKNLNLEEVIHFAYQKPAGDVLGISMHKPILDDIRALRDQEEYAIKLFEKMLFPIIHHQVPKQGDDLYGTSEDVDQAAYGYSGIAPDGILITPPGHEIKMIGAAGEALNPVPQLTYMMQRVFMGEGLSSTIMGIESSSAGTSDVLTTQMHDRVKSFQQDLEEVINLHIIYELLVEAGYDVSKEEESAYLEYNEIEDEARIREENHSANLFTNGIINEDEARETCQKNPFGSKERKGKQIYTDKFPVMQEESRLANEAANDAADKTHAQAKELALHTHKISKDAQSHDANIQKDLVASGVSPSAKQQTAMANSKTRSDIAKSQTPRPAVRKSTTSVNAKSTGAKRALASKVDPSNQHGSRGVARASSQPAAGIASKRRPRSASISPSVKGK